MVKIDNIVLLKVAESINDVEDYPCLDRLLYWRSSVGITTFCFSENVLILTNREYCWLFKPKMSDFFFLAFWRFYFTVTWLLVLWSRYLMVQLPFLMFWLHLQFLFLFGVLWYQHVSRSGFLKHSPCLGFLGLPEWD